MDGEPLVVTLHRARPLGSNDVVRKVTIMIDGELESPSTDSLDWEGEAWQRYRAEADRLLDALCGSLPGGTIHAMLVGLLERKRSLLIVRGE